MSDLSGAVVVAYLGGLVIGAFIVGLCWFIVDVIG